jgi:hypothetical protein
MAMLGSLCRETPLGCVGRACLAKWVPMTNHDRKPNRNLFAIIGIAIACAWIAGAIALTLLWKPKAPYKDTTAEVAQICRPDTGVLAKLPPSIRASTQVVPWGLFKQRFTDIFAKEETISAQSVPGGKALRLAIPKKGELPQNIGVSMLNDRPIKKGEVIEARVWLRSLNVRATNQTPVSVEIRFQNNDPGFARFFNRRFLVTNTFREYSFSAAAPKDYCVEQFNVALHLATGKHQIDIGPGQIVVTETAARP